MGPIERTVHLPVDVDLAWGLLVDPDALQGWLGDEVALRPVPGAAGHVLERDGTRRRLVVEAVAASRRLAWRWWDEEAGDGAASRVELTLTPTAEGTTVRVVEHPPVQAPASARAAAGGAWEHRLLHLELALLQAAVVHTV